MGVLRSRNFKPEWVGWILRELESGKTHISCNGWMGKEIKCKGGLREGDPLSPLLFTLVADGLNTIIVKAKEAGLVTSHKKY